MVFGFDKKLNMKTKPKTKVFDPIHLEDPNYLVYGTVYQYIYMVYYTCTTIDL